MIISEHSPTQKKIITNNNNENSINNESSEIKIVEESTVKNTDGKGYHHKEKDKNSKKSNVKKINNDIEIVQEKKIVKVKTLIDDDFINEYDPMIQDNSNPKLNFFIDNDSVSDSDRDLSSASLSNESMENNKEDNK